MHPKHFTFCLMSLFLAFLILSCGSGQASSERPSATQPIPTAMDTPITAIDTPDFSKAELLGQIEQSKHEDFVVIDRKFTNKDNIYLRKAAYESFLEMRSAAAKEGLNLTILSATRNFNYQKRIWENKWLGNWQVEGKNLAKSYPEAIDRAKVILRYSSMPGTSRHHWGTDIDLNSLNNSYFESGTGKNVYDWLTAHGPEYGFCQVYSPKGENRPHGYEMEKWHWSYLPIAGPMLKAYELKILPSDVKGFKGAEVVAPLDVISKYVFGISPDCGK